MMGANHLYTHMRELTDCAARLNLLVERILYLYLVSAAETMRQVEHGLLYEVNSPMLRTYDERSSSKAFAPCRRAVSKLSVNQP